jgi:hypothetical protein
MLIIRGFLSRISQTQQKKVWSCQKLQIMLEVVGVWVLE